MSAAVEIPDQMKRLLILSLIAFAGAAQAAPAPPAWATLSARETRAAERIDAAAKAGQVSGPEAERLRLKLHRVQSLRAYYRKSHGLSAWERRDLERRLKAIDARLAKETHARR